MSTIRANSADRIGHLLVPGREDLGPVVEVRHVVSSPAPVNTFRVQVNYPRVVWQALGLLYGEYNRAFAALVEANREWSEDYLYCRQESGAPLNGWVQIDMVGLTPEFLSFAKGCTAEELAEILRTRFLYEIENSIAYYELLGELFQLSPFKRSFRASLDRVRQRHGMPIALLAVTAEKRAAMMAGEFGKEPRESVTDDEVRALTGFDRFFGPEEFRAYVTGNGGCDYLLYVRASDPIEKLRKPNVEVVHPLLGDPAMRRIIRSRALTLNVDDPNNPARGINDTKGYMPEMRMGYRVDTWDQVVNPKFVQHLKAGQAPDGFSETPFSEGLTEFLCGRGVDRELVSSGRAYIHAKPYSGTFGCYGHHHGSMREADFRGELRKDIVRRGSYLIQPAMPASVVENAYDEQCFHYADRNFLSMNPDGTIVCFGGFRNMIPAGSVEARSHRIHGQGAAAWLAIL